MMSPSQCVYYSDPTLYLDLNIKNKEKELISMLDQFEQGSCFVCQQQICACAGTSTGQKCFVLSTPEKKIMNNEIEAWIKASKLKEMSDLEMKKQQVKQNLVNNKTCTAAEVDAFFRCFQMSSKTSAEVLSNRLAEAFMQIKQKNHENYSYF